MATIVDRESTENQAILAEQDRCAHCEGCSSCDPLDPESHPLQAVDIFGEEVRGHLPVFSAPSLDLALEVMNGSGEFRSNGRAPNWVMLAMEEDQDVEMLMKKGRELQALVDERRTR